MSAALRQFAVRWTPRLRASHTVVPRAAFSRSAPRLAAHDLTFVSAEGEQLAVRAEEGQSLLDIAHANNIDLEGACEGSLACSTCHVILEQDVYDKLPEPTDEENDMLDLAFGLTDTSRLGCQVLLSKDLAGAKIRLPSATRNMAVDGFKPKPH
ncbi:mitochondrial matrix iron-sulfur protein [Sorochytrium milnesiophthora]